MQATPVIDNIELETNPLAIETIGGNVSFSKEITNTPNEISSISSIAFEDGASLQLNVINPDINPLLCQRALAQ